MTKGNSCAFASVFGLDEEDDSLLGQVFGSNSTVHNEVFVEKVTRIANWVFDSTKIRKRIFKEANVRMKHIRRSSLLDFGAELTGLDLTE